MSADYAGRTPLTPQQWFALLVLAVGTYVAVYGYTLVLQKLRRRRLIQQTVGLAAKVSATIPAHKQGAGKVKLLIENRTLEYRAVCASADKLIVGYGVIVAAVVGPETVEVIRGLELDWPAL